MRRTATPAITAQMYKHFATLTVAFTALVAVFANGEKQQAVAAETAVSRPHETQAHSRMRNRSLLQSTRAVRTREAGATTRLKASVSPRSASSSPESWFSSPFGSTPERRVGLGDYPTLQDSEDGDETPSLHGAAADPTVPTAAEIAAAAAASRQRSGASGSD